MIYIGAFATCKRLNVLFFIHLERTESLVDTAKKKRAARSKWKIRWVFFCIGWFNEAKYKKYQHTYTDSRIQQASKLLVFFFFKRQFFSHPLFSYLFCSFWILILAIRKAHQTLRHWSLHVIIHAVSSHMNFKYVFNRNQGREREREWAKKNAKKKKWSRMTTKAIAHHQCSRSPSHFMHFQYCLSFDEKFVIIVHFERNRYSCSCVFIKIYIYHWSCLHTIRIRYEFKSLLLVRSMIECDFVVRYAVFFNFHSSKISWYSPFIRPLLFIQQKPINTKKSLNWDCGDNNEQ